MGKEYFKLNRNVIDYPLREGDGYIVSHRFSDVGNGTTVALFVDNPSGSGKSIVATQIAVVGNGQADFDVSEDVIEDTQGTTIEIHNRQIGNNKTSVATVTHGGSYSGKDTNEFLQSIIIGGGAGEQRFGGASGSGVLELLPGSNILVELTNGSGGTEDYAITTRWTEINP